MSPRMRKTKLWSVGKEVELHIEKISVAEEHSAHIHTVFRQMRGVRFHLFRALDDSS